MAKANPQTPDCAIRGCGKKARRLGMCAEHARMAPTAFGEVAAERAQQAAERAAAIVHRSAQRYVRALLRAEKQAAR